MGPSVIAAYRVGVGSRSYRAGMDNRLGEVAVVTGAARGIGGAIARALASEVAHVVVSDVDAEAGAAMAARIGNATFVRCDTGDERDVRALIESAGPVDVLVNNAGIPEAEPYPSDQSWVDAIRVNLIGTMAAIQAVLPGMRGREGGAVLNVSSVAGIGLGPHPLPTYAATKAAINKLTASLESLHRADNVRVNAICPDFVATEALVAEHRALSTEQRRAAGMPERLVPLEKVASAAVDMLCDEGLTGRVLDCPHDRPWALLPR